MDVVTDAHLAALTTANYQNYKALVIGDGPNGASDYTQTIANVAAWRAAVQGNVILQGGDAASHRMTDAAAKFTSCVLPVCSGGSAWFS